MSELRIPEEAMPVALVLRRDVERPTAKIHAGDDGAPWPQPRFECGKCAMGLHPDALNLTPALPSSFRHGEMRDLMGNAGADSAGYAFWNWWDKLTVEQAYEALDLIWPPTTAEEN